MNALQTFTCTYGSLNRLTHAVFTQDKYNETLTYDNNGNIQSLIRKGKVNTSYSIIDQLSYAYHGNRLLAVNDLNTTATQAHGFTDNGLFKTGNPTDPLTYEYTYDVNGNLMDDANKMLHILSYNYLNLPDSIDFENDLKIKYLYASGGAKLRQITYNGGTPTEQLDYSGSFVYENSSLKFIMTSEGRLIPNGSTFEREYFLTDHLGNTRVTFKKSGDSALIVKENHYYAYGMEISDQSFSSTPVPNTFLYNGKEYDQNTGYYQYGFRQYDAQIGRWHVVDAMSETYYSTSPYMYVMGNPVSSYDVLGLYMTQADKRIQGNVHIWNSYDLGFEHRIAGEIYSTAPSFEDLYTFVKGTQGSAWVRNNDMAPSPENLAGLGLSSFKNNNGNLIVILSFHKRSEYNENGEPVDGKTLSMWGFGYLEIPEVLAFLYDGVHDWRDMLWGPSNRDNNPYLPWKPDAFQAELGYSGNLIGIINYSVGAGITASNSETAIHMTFSYTFLPTLNNIGSNAKKGVSGGWYFSFEMLENLTSEPLSLDAYQGNGMNTTLGLGDIGLYYSNSTDVWMHPENGKGPFAANTNLYNGYGFVINPGVGLSRSPTYTWYPFRLKF